MELLIIMNKTYRLFLCCFVCVLSTSIKCAADNIEAYARVSGIVRYYSPNPYTEKWDNSDWLCIDYANFSAICEGQPLEKILNQYLSVFAPNSSITQVPSPGVREILDDESDYCYWLHHGCGEIKLPGIMRALKKELRDYRPFYKELVPCTETGFAERQECPRPDSVYSYMIADGLYLNIPLAESRNTFSKSETVSRLKDAKKKFSKSMKASGNSARDKIFGMVGDKAFRFADMAFRWNIIQHFYPYHKEDGLDWESHLPRMIEAVDTLKDGKRTRPDIKIYHEAVLRAMNPVKDGHLLIYPVMNLGGMVSFYMNYGYAPVAFSRDPTTGIISIPGDCDVEILKINGIEASLLFEDCRHKINTSNEALAAEMALEKMTETTYLGEPLVVESSDDNGVRIDTLYGTLKYPLYEESSSDYSMMVMDSILIFNPSISMNCYEGFLPCIDSIMHGEYRALVFDLRDYPALDFDKVLSHIIDTAISTSPMFHTPLSCFPNREHIHYSESFEQLQPVLPRIDIPVFFLSSHNTISWGETVLMLVKGYGLGTIIGTPTAGTNGDATSIPLPMFSFRMTAIKATNVDGSRHHGVGVNPDIYMESRNLTDYISIINNELHRKY